VVAIVALSDLGLTPWKPLVDALPGQDKTGHFLLLGTLSLAVHATWPGRSWLCLGPLRVTTATLVLAILAGLEEASQAAFPLRTVSWEDLAAGLAGILLLGPLGLAFHPRRPRAHPSPRSIPGQ